MCTSCLIWFFDRWFRSSDVHLQSYSDSNMQVWSNEFEEPSFMSILPVNLIYSPIAIRINHHHNINIVTNLSPKVYL